MAPVIGVIPARFESKRFPGKLLSPLLGQSVISRTAENLRKARLLSDIVIATDDLRIFDHVQELGLNAIMTPPECPSGSDRVAFAAAALQLPIESILINVQGDWPLIEPEVIDQVAGLLLRDPDLEMATAAIRLERAEDLFNPSIVKVVRDANGNALYFSRAPIPHSKQMPTSGLLPTGQDYLGHLGIYGYRLPFLRRYAQIPMTPLQKTEDLEQLKVLETGGRISVAIVKAAPMSIDTPQDISKVEAYLCQSTSSSPEGSSPLSAKG